MSPKQKKLAAKAPPPNKIDEKDFAVLRAEKAKGRGMGLQDEKVQPGKVMKAKRGKLGEAKDYKKYLKGLKKATSEVRGAKLNSPAYNITTYDQKSYERAGGKGKAVFKDYKGLGIKNEDQYFKEKNASKFMKRRKELGAAGKALSATRIGKIVLPVAAAGVAAQQYLKSKMKKDKKMGGGMMKKYSKGSEKKLMTPEERADYVKKAKVSLKATAESLKDKLHPKKSDRLFSKHKKMGGGMMQKPMGYKSGMGPAGAAGPSAGRPGGRRPMQQGPKGGIGSMPKKRSDDLVILVNSGDGKIKKMKRSEFEDNMSAPKQKMGGGMMQKPMGYKSGNTVRGDIKLGRALVEAFGSKKTINKMKANIQDQNRVKKMGGGMIAPSQRPGYSKGTMVKARGCKLGRTRPTKIT